MKAKKYQGGGKMKEMKKKDPSRLHTSKASRDRESYKRDVREGYAPLPFAGGLPKRMTDAEDRAATKKEREKGKKLRYENGGKYPKGLKKSKDDNKRMIDRDSVKKKKRKVVPFLSKKGSNRKMK